MSIVSDVCTRCGVGNGIELLLCDGHDREKNPCSSSFCFNCAQVLAVPMGDWFCRLCSGKRASLVASSPVTNKSSRTTVSLSPDIREKVLTAMQKDRLTPFPFGVSGVSTTPTTSNSLGLTEALNLITAKLTSLDTKMSNVATVDQINSLKTDFVKFEQHIQELKIQFEQLDKENTELKARVTQLEKKIQSLSLGQTPSKFPDVAFRRISFIGLPVQEELARVKFITEWLSQHFPGVTCSVGNIYKGTVKDRKLTGIAYAEFSDSDLRNTILKQVKNKNLTCSYNGASIMVKPALSQLIRDRIWSVNTAFELVQKHAAATGKNVEKRKDGKRGIFVEGVLAFDQSTANGIGCFAGAFTDLDLPRKSSS